MLDLTEQINDMVKGRGMSEEKVESFIEDILRSAYKKRYSTDENIKIKFSEEPNDDGEIRKLVSVLSLRKVVDEDHWYNPVTEISIEEVESRFPDRKFNLGDTVEIEVNPSEEFESASIQSAKQKGTQIVKEFNTDRVYSKAKDFEGKLVNGEISRAKGADFLVNLNLENTEALFPVRGQSPRETYDVGDRLKFYVEKVDRGDEILKRSKDGKTTKSLRGVKILLSRSSKEFIQALIENEVPEIASGDVEIKGIVRQAGQRTKIAVDTHKSDIDPVGSTVGQGGVRIKTIMNECEGERIDVVRWDDDPLAYIANALIPAQVRRVVTIDPDTKHVVAIVDENQQGIAIGPGGVNVKLAKMLCDWNIEVKNQGEFEQMEIVQRSHEDFNQLFKDEGEESESRVEISDDETRIEEIGLPEELTEKLKSIGIWTIEKFFDYDDEELMNMGLDADEIEVVRNSVTLEIEEEEEEDGSFYCPKCHTLLEAGTTVCPSCGAEFEFGE